MSAVLTTENLRSWGKENVPKRIYSYGKDVLFYFFYYSLFVLAVYSSGPYLLSPYYAIQQGESIYQEPLNFSMPTGSYMSYIKTVTSGNRTLLISDLDITLVVNAGFTSPFINGTEKCPPRFIKSQDYEGPCEYILQEDIRFFQFAASFDTLAPAYSGLSEAPQDVSDITFHLHGDAKDLQNLTYQIELLRFDTSGHNCESADDCQAFLEKANESKQFFPYQDDTLRCFSQDDHRYLGWNYTGCAVGVKIGSEEDCFKDSREMKCEFAAFVMFFNQPPYPFMIAGIWGWGMIMFILVEFFWVFLSLRLGRRLHLKYLRLYNITAHDILSFRADRWYDFVLHVTGEQFTKRIGTFNIFDSGGSIRYTYPINAVFPEEEFDNAKVCRLYIHTSWKADDNFVGDFGISWSDEYHTANAHIPDSSVEIVRRVPRGMKSLLYLISMPLSFLITLIVAFQIPGKIKNKKRLLMIGLYMLVFHISWISVILFNFFCYTPGLNDKIGIWGSLDEPYPVPALVLYITYVISMAMTAITSMIGTVLFRKTKRQNSGDLSLRSMATRDSTLIPSFSPGAAGRRVTNSHYQKDLLKDFSTVEYVPMKEHNVIQELKIQ